MRSLPAHLEDRGGGSACRESHLIVGNTSAFEREYGIVLGAEPNDEIARTHRADFFVRVDEHRHDAVIREFQAVKD